MSDVLESWSLPWHALQRSLAQGYCVEMSGCDELPQKHLGRAIQARRNRQLARARMRGRPGRPALARLASQRQLPRILVFVPGLQSHESQNSHHDQSQETRPEMTLYDTDLDIEMSRLAIRVEARSTKPVSPHAPHTNALRPIATPAERSMRRSAGWKRRRGNIQDHGKDREARGPLLDA